MQVQTCKPTGKEVQKQQIKYIRNIDNVFIEIGCFKGSFSSQVKDYMN